jgi:hypothetical protein
MQSPLPFRQHQPERVNHSGDEEEKGQHEIDQRVLDGVGLQLNRQRRQEETQDDEQDFHRVCLPNDSVLYRMATGSKRSI